jgi:hypothetical protein
MSSISPVLLATVFLCSGCSAPAAYVAADSGRDAGSAGAASGGLGGSGGSSAALGGATASGGTASGGTAAGGGNSTGGTGGASPSEKPRIIATTDGEVDDRSSMVRFLMYASDYDVAGIVQVNSKFQRSGHSGEKWAEEALTHYASILPNLRKHRPDYPDADELRRVLTVGNENEADLYRAPPDFAVKDTPGSQLIIDTLLDDDPRPVHVPSWGGANTTAYALWKLKTSYTQQQYEYAVSRIRIYCIWYQDGGGSWIQNNIPGALIFEANGWDEVWDYGSVSGSVNPDYVKAYMTNDWLRQHVKQNHGPLGAYYPQDYVSEGDTPSFLPLIDNGLESHLDYTLGGWGGRARVEYGNYLRDAQDDGSINKPFYRWVPAAQNDFAARMDWAVASSFADANHPPRARAADNAVRTVSPGETVTLDASASSDPDGDTLSFSWWQYYDADSAQAKVTINNSTSASGASFIVPSESGKSIHVILEVTDDGTPQLKHYQRLVFEIR